MKTITLQEAYTLIENASAIIFDDNALMYPSLGDLTGHSCNEWLYLEWEEDDNIYKITFIEEPEIKFDGTSIYMCDSNGDECELTLLVPMDRNSFIYTDEKGVNSLM
jgi:hypothetical protein